MNKVVSVKWHCPHCNYITSVEPMCKGCPACGHGNSDFPKGWSKYVPMDDKYNTDQKCLHDGCPDCNGSGVKKNGEICVHFISCPCKKCNPYFM